MNDPMNNGNPGIRDRYNNLNPTSKKIAKALIAVAVLIAVYAIFSMIFSGEERPVQQRQEAQQFLSIDQTAEADEALSAQIALQREIDDLQTKTDIEIESLKYEMFGLSEQISNLVELLETQATMPPAPVEGSTTSSSAGSGTTGNTPPKPATRVEVGGIRRINVVPVAETTATEDATVKKNNYFPTTTLLKGVLLNGLYAPTLTKGQSSPHPAFIRVDDLSILPNDFRRDIEGCEFMGEAYGELSDSRVHIRLTKLACVAYDGRKYFDNAVQGVVFGEDGTLGIPGETLANFNKILATSTFVYFLGGLGSAIRDSSQTTVVSSDGTATEYMEGSDWEKTQKSMFAGAGEGLNEGLGRVGDFYMDILDDMVPVVRINGGRDVEIKLTEGVELNLLDNNWTWGGELINELEGLQ